MIPVTDPLPPLKGIFPFAVEDWDQGEKGADRRNAEFVVGRYCARSALSQLRPHDVSTPIGIRADRGPHWPDGIVGSITHCAGFAAALVAEEAEYWGIGRDTEPLLKESIGKEVGPWVALPDEVETVSRALELDDLTALTLIFSAKESLFKCLSPRTGIFFDFSEARVEEGDRQKQTYRIRLLRPLGVISVGTVFEGDYRFDGARVHTRCVWRPHLGSA